MVLYRRWGIHDMAIDTIFGADLTLFDGVKVQPRLAGFDSRARLVNLW